MDSDSDLALISAALNVEFNTTDWDYLLDRSENDTLLLSNDTSDKNGTQYSILDEKFDVEIQWLLIIMYSICAMLSITGNIIVIFTLKCGRRSPKDLRVYLINLALTDIIMGFFSIPFT